MIWESWSDFLSMGGYGVYVWGSYFMTIVCIVGEIILIRKRHRTLHKHLGLIHESTEKEIKNETSS